MQKAHSVRLQAHEEAETKIFHLALPGLLPSGRTLVLNLEIRTLSLLTEGPTLMIEHQLSVNEICVTKPLLEFYPYYCPYEVLLAHISSNCVTEASIVHCRRRLQEALSRGTWQQDLRPIRRALSSLRNKLKDFDLGISNIRERGSILISLRSHVPSRSSNSSLQ